VRRFRASVEQRFIDCGGMRGSGMNGGGGMHGGRVRCRFSARQNNTHIFPGRGSGAVVCELCV
jgi:hypothetical protein